MQKLTNKGESPLAFSHQPKKGEPAFEPFELSPGWGKELNEAAVKALKEDDSVAEYLQTGILTLVELGTDPVAKESAQSETIETVDDKVVEPEVKAQEPQKPAKATTKAATESPEKEAADAELKAALEGK
jgi:hypothetical protein